MKANPIGLLDKPFALVIWEDANGNAAQEYAEADMPGFHKPAVYHSWGWVIISDDRGVSLVNEWCPKDESYRSRMFIPRGMIREEIPLQISRSRIREPRSVPRRSRSSDRTGDKAFDHSTPQIVDREISPRA